MYQAKAEVCEEMREVDEGGKGRMSGGKWRRRTCIGGWKGV